MRVTVTTAAAALAAACALLPEAVAWNSRWDLSKRFKAVGHVELECDGKTQVASCCICQSIVHEIETQLNNTADDYDIDVVFRISEEKKQIKFSRSEARILEVLDGVCTALPLTLPDSTKKKQKVLSAACETFVDEFADELTRTFFNDFTPAKHRACSNTINVCPAPVESPAEAPKDDL